MNNGFKKGNFRVLIPKNKCALCEITEKETDESFIEINHKDQNQSNNEISNLWALCKFCHDMKIKCEENVEEETFWAIDFGTLDPHVESIQRLDDKKNVIRVPMTIKKFVYEISLDYFKGKGAPKDHNVIINLFGKKIDEIKHNRRVEIYKKMYPNFEIKFNTPEDGGDYK